MGTQKVETDALSDDQLDAVSGGDKADLISQAKQQALENARQAAENKAQSDALKGFQQLLNGIT
jgi:hypothetical protein